MVETDEIRAFLEQHHSAAMISLRPDGTPHAVRVGVVLVDGKLWSSGLPGRARTGYLRRDPRCTLFVFDPAYSYLTLETTVTILEGTDVPEQSVRLFRVMQAGRMEPSTPGGLFWEGQEKSPEEFRRIMAEQRRLIYEFEIHRAYGMYGTR
jgi:PPOX class probable F420-dependent enzyme